MHAACSFGFKFGGYMDWPWGHTSSCPCSVCSTLRRICGSIRRGGSAPGFLEFTTRELRGLWGSLEDFLDRIPIPPCTGERLGQLKSEGGTAPPAPASGREANPSAGVTPETPKKEASTPGEKKKDSAPALPLPGLSIAPKASSVSSRARSSGTSRRREEDREGDRRVKPERVSRSRKRRTKDRKKDRSRSRRRRRVSPSREPETVEVKVQCEPFTVIT